MTTVAEVLQAIGLTPHPCGSQETSRAVSGPGTIHRAAEDQVAFATPALLDGADHIRRSRAALILAAGPVLDELAAEAPAAPHPVLAASPNPRLDFVRTLDAFFDEAAPAAGIHHSAQVAPTAVVDPSATIGAFCCLGPEVIIGAQSRLGPGVHLRGPVRLGARVASAPGP